MLVLARGLNDVVNVYDRDNNNELVLSITVAEFTGKGRVRLGFKAASRFLIIRKELEDAKKASGDRVNDADRPVRATEQ